MTKNDLAFETLNIIVHMNMDCAHGLPDIRFAASGCTLRSDFSPRFSFNLSFLENKKPSLRSEGLWAHMGSNHGPLDYESSALTS